MKQSYHTELKPVTQIAPNPLQGGDGDINSLPISMSDRNFFPEAIAHQEWASIATKSTPVKGFGIEKEEIKQPQTSERLLCHHAFPDGIPDDIMITLANYSADRVRATLASINQIVYHLCRKSVSGRVSAATLSGFVAGGVIKLGDTVAYSCQWAAQQMQRWWGEGMSATTFRRIRDDLEAWGGFVIDRVAPGSTRKITNLQGVDLPQLLRLAALCIQRLSAELDGFELLMPAHRCGFLASLWRLYFAGTIYAPDADVAERSVESLEGELAKAQQLATEFSWSQYLADTYRSQVDRLKRQVRFMRDRLRSESTDTKLFEESLPY